MINKLLMGIISLIVGLVNIILSPIDLMITNVFPTISDGLNLVSSLFTWLSNLIPWAVSWFGFYTPVLTLFVACVTFQLTVPALAYTIKLAIKWYDKLKP